MNNNDWNDDINSSNNDDKEINWIDSFQKLFNFPMILFPINGNTFVDINWNEVKGAYVDFLSG